VYGAGSGRKDLTARARQGNLFPLPRTGYKLQGKAKKWVVGENGAADFLTEALSSVLGNRKSQEHPKTADRGRKINIPLRIATSVQ